MSQGIDWKLFIRHFNDTGLGCNWALFWHLATHTDGAKGNFIYGLEGRTGQNTPRGKGVLRVKYVSDGFASFNSAHASFPAYTIGMPGFSGS